MDNPDMGIETASLTVENWYDDQDLLLLDEHDLWGIADAVAAADARDKAEALANGIA